MAFIDQVCDHGYGIIYMTQHTLQNLTFM